MRAAPQTGSNILSAWISCWSRTTPSYVGLTLRALREIAGNDLRSTSRARRAGAAGSAQGKGGGSPASRHPGHLHAHDGASRCCGAYGRTRIPAIFRWSCSPRPAGRPTSPRAIASAPMATWIRPLNFQSYINVLADVIAYWLVINVPDPCPPPKPRRPDDLQGAPSTKSEVAVAPFGAPLHFHHQGARRIARFSREVQLRRQRAPADALQLDLWICRGRPEYGGGRLVSSR